MTEPSQDKLMPTEEIAWLVEYPEQGRYLSLHDSDNPPYWLTQDHNIAMRFSRKIDAEAIICRHELAGVAVEHMWVNAPARPTTDVSTDVLVERLARIIQTADTLWLGSELDTIAEAKRRIEAMDIQRNDMARLIEALQRSNAEKDELLARWLRLADSGHFRDTAQLSLAAHPVADDTRKALGDKTDA